MAGGKLITAPLRLARSGGSAVRDLVKGSYNKNLGRLAKVGVGGKLGVVGAGIWTALSPLTKIAGFIMDMMQFSAIMSTQEMVTELKDQVDSLKYKSPQFSEQVATTKKYIENEQDDLDKVLSQTSHQLNTLSNTETNIRVINGKPLDSIMYGFDANIDDTMLNKYQLSGSDVQLMNSPNIGFNELAKATLNSKQDVINEVRKSRNDSVKALNRNARMISNTGKLAGTHLKYSEEKFNKLDQKLDILNESLNAQAKAGLAGHSALTDLVDSSKEEPQEKSTGEKIGEMIAKVATIPERLALFGAKYALGVLVAASSAKLIYDLINKAGDNETASGLNEDFTNAAILEYEAREAGLAEPDVRKYVRDNYEDLRREQANTVEGYDKATYNYISDIQSTSYDAKDASGNTIGNLRLDNQTLDRLHSYYDPKTMRQLTDKSKGYTGSVMYLANIITQLFFLYSPKSLSAVTQSCITVNMLPKDLKKEIDAKKGDPKALNQCLHNHTDVFAKRVLIPTVNYAAKLIVDLVCYKGPKGKGNVVKYDKANKKFINTSLVSNLSDKKDIEDVRHKLYNLIVNVLLGKGRPENCYGSVDLYADAGDVIASRSSVSGELTKFGANVGGRAAQGAINKVSGSLGVITGLTAQVVGDYYRNELLESTGANVIEKNLVNKTDNKDEGWIKSTLNAAINNAGAVAYDLVTWAANRSPMIGVFMGVTEYLVGVGIDLRKATASMDYYSGIINVFELCDPKNSKLNFNPCESYLIGTASGALLSRILMFYKTLCKSYMDSYQGSYYTKGEALIKEGKAEFRSGFYYLNNGDKMDFSLNDKNDLSLFEQATESESLMNSFKGSAFGATDGEYTNAMSKFNESKVRNVTDNLQNIFRSGSGINLVSNEIFDTLGNIGGRAIYAKDRKGNPYIHAFNLDDTNDSPLTKSLFDGMNRYIRDQKGDKYEPGKDTVKVTYTSGARDWNPHDPNNVADEGWTSHHKYGLAVDVGNLDATMKAVGKLNSTKYKGDLKKMVDYINRELNVNGASKYKVVLEPNADDKSRYHLHIVNGEPFTTGKLPYLPDDKYVENFKKNFILGKKEGYDWTRFGTKDSVYYDKTNVGMNKEILDTLKSASNYDYSKPENRDIGDPNEALTAGNVNEKIDDLAKLVAANSLKIDAVNESIPRLFGMIAQSSVNVGNMIKASNNSGNVPGIELMNTESRSL